MAKHRKSECRRAKYRRKNVGKKTSMSRNVEGIKHRKFKNIEKKCRMCKMSKCKNIEKKMWKIKISKMLDIE